MVICVVRELVCRCCSFFNHIQLSNQVDFLLRQSIIRQSKVNRFFLMQATSSSLFKDVQFGFEFLILRRRLQENVLFLSAIIFSVCGRIHCVLELRQFCESRTRVECKFKIMFLLTAYLKPGDNDGCTHN